MEKQKKPPLALLDDDRKEKYLFTFVLAFGISAVVFMFFAIMRGGLFIYYGDYNYQQIPFYYHVHEAVREGRLMWDHTTELGSDIIKSYGFYLIGSPFFWLTVPFPNEALPYLMPWLLSLKTAVAALTAYAYIRGFSENTNACCLGAMLYAFSGFQLYNIVFNHFHDAAAFFPLLLYASDQLFMKNKKGIFALTVALCALTNYFFFAGMAVFTVSYFAVNVFTGRYRFSPKGFAGYAFEAVMGTACSAVILLPAIEAVLSDNRAGSLLSPENSLIYSKEPITYLFILKSFFTIPDLCLDPAISVSEDLGCSSASAYLPFVSLCGVIAYLSRKPKKDMPAVMLIICGACMLVPVLNSAFYMFNSTYYARWFYMPVLIMCVMTAVAADEDVMLFKKGIFPCMGAAGAYLVIGLILNAVSESFDVDLNYLLIQSLGAAACLALMYTMLGDKSLSDNKARLNGLMKRSFICCGALMLLVVFLGKATYSGEDKYIKTCIGSRGEVESMVMGENGEQLVRVDVCENYTNYNLMWDMSSLSSFISIVSPSITEFYENIGFPRIVNTNVPANYSALRSLMSVKYYFDMPLYDGNEMREPFPILSNSIESFEYKGVYGNMLAYENKAYIPMGFAYDYFMTDEEFKAVDNKFFGSQALLEALVLDEEQAGRYSDIISRYDNDSCRYEDTARLMEVCSGKASQSCEYFRADNDGFDAKITLDNDKLVFFSVPYDKGWTARINGEKVPVEKVSYGFMAVRCSAGESVIRFDYRSDATIYGMYISLASLFILIVYFAAAKLIGKRAEKRI